MSTDHPPTLVRPASAVDLGSTADLLRREARFAQRLDPWFELRPGFDWPGLAGRLLARADTGLFVAEQESHLVGLILVRLLRPPAPPRPDRRSWLRRLLRPRRPSRRRLAGPLEPAVWGVIESCWVEEDSRRQGIGRLLVEEAESWLRAEGAQRLRLGVAARNEDAQHFWQQLGFRPYRLRYLREL